MPLALSPLAARPNTHLQGGRLQGPGTKHRPGRPGPRAAADPGPGWAQLTPAGLGTRRGCGRCEAERALRGWGRRRTPQTRLAGQRSGGASCTATFSSSCCCSRGGGGGGGGCLGEINKSGLSFGSALAAILSRTSERPEFRTEAGRRHLRVASVNAV